MKNYYFSYAFIIAVALVANILFIQSSIFGAVLAVGYFSVAAAGWSKLFTTKTAGEAYAYGLFMALLLLSLVGAIVYRIYLLDNFAALGVLLLILLAPSFIREFYKKHTQSPQITGYTIAFFALSLILTAGLTYVLITAATTESIRSPWEVVPAPYWTILFLFWLTWIIGLIRLPREKPWYILPSFLMLALYNMYTVALIVYPIGFGFDSFIHQATEKLIADAGIATPKPWYYLGQYSFVVLLHKLSLLPIVWIDKLLLPVTTIIYLAIVGTRILEKWLNKSHATTLTIASLLLIPASFLIVTTPQGLANLLFILLVLATTISGSSYLLFLLALTAAAIHPLAGIPALLLAALVAIPKFAPKFSTAISTAFTLLAIPVIPLLFWWQNTQQVLATNFFPLAASNLDQSLLYFGNRFDLIYDTIYLWHWNGVVIVSILALIGIAIAYQKSATRLLPVALTTTYLLANYLILSNAVDFNFLISYERAAFADRFVDLAVIAALPFVALALHAMFRKVFESDETWRLQFTALSFALLATITVYTIYPRVDAYDFSRGYSTSNYDIEAVRLIHEQGDDNYVVLANQSVSAAALSEFGFYKYYNRQDESTGEQIFFYPIPTGGSLYQIYLEMVYNSPSRVVAEKAMALTGVNTVYFILNDYWYNSAEIANSVELENTESWSIDDKIRIYKFTRN